MVQTQAYISSRAMRVPLDPAVVLGRPAAALRNNRYEARGAEAALRIVQRGDTVLELGGGTGYVSTPLCRHRRPAHVHVFEANPHLVPSRWIGPEGVNAMFGTMIAAGLASFANTLSNTAVCFRRDWLLK